MALRPCGLMGSEEAFIAAFDEANEELRDSSDPRADIRRIAWDR
jgi:hypothetical protein